MIDVRGVQRDELDALSRITTDEGGKFAAQVRSMLEAGTTRLDWSCAAADRRAGSTREVHPDGLAASAYEQPLAAGAQHEVAPGDRWRYRGVGLTDAFVVDREATLPDLASRLAA